MKLPEAFLERMKNLLGEEYDSWLDSYRQVPATGFRINPAKVSREEWERICPWEVRRVPWNEYGYYCEGSLRPAKDVYYYGGLYYIQEPSAMAPAAVLGVQPGQRVLDLCAAPGGKSTELGARLSGRGFLAANDISVSRAKALLKNIEMAGIGNACVTAEEPERLAEAFGEFFDKILVDAPCSGEGMFRREPELIKSWTERGPEYYVPVQRNILKQAVRMLKPGGEMVYSTCTFCEEEDEGAIDWILKNEPAMELVPLETQDGVCGGVDGKPVLRLFPHRIEGEGHFVALLRKKKEGECVPGGGTRAEPEEKSGEGKWLEEESDFLEWEKLLAKPLDRKRLMVQKGQVYVLPEGFDRELRLRFLRTGLLAGSVKKGRFEPSQAMAMALGKGGFARSISLKREDERAVRYLKGESIFLKEDEKVLKGWALVCVDGFPLGWAKAGGNGLKNKYYPGWRWQ